MRTAVLETICGFEVPLVETGGLRCGMSGWARAAAVLGSKRAFVDGGRSAAASTPGGS